MSVERVALRVPHARRSLRLRGYDYSRSGTYFVTIRTRNSEPVFGPAVSKRVQLSAAGRVAQRCWQEIPKHFPNVTLDAFVVMPDHLHGIVVIGGIPNSLGVGAQHAAPLHLTVPPSIAPRHRVAPGSLGAIVRSFKSASTKRINEMRGTSGASVWQRNYFDRIIRDSRELDRLRWYIRMNPARPAALRKGQGL